MEMETKGQEIHISFISYNLENLHAFANFPVMLVRIVYLKFPLRILPLRPFRKEF